MQISIRTCFVSLLALRATGADALHCCPSGYRATTNNLAGGCALGDRLLGQGNITFADHPCLEFVKGSPIRKVSWQNQTSCGPGCGYYEYALFSYFDIQQCNCSAVASKTACAQQCDDEAQCGGFEYDSGSQQCWLIFREEGLVSAGGGFPMWNSGVQTGGYEACVKDEVSSDCTYNSNGNHNQFASHPTYAVDCTEEPQEAPCSSAGAVWGDPHIVTWSGKVVDFMGECDLVLVKSNMYHHGKGLEVQIRTEIQEFWSITSAVAVKIDSSVLEIQSSGKYFLDGAENVDLLNANIAGHRITWQSKIMDSEANWIIFSIHLANGANIHVTVRNKLLDVNLENAKHNDFGDSIGLMGSLSRRKMLGRDGQTVFKDYEVYGQEWQVLKGDMLFMDVGEGPQHPAKCNFPSEARKSFLYERRKLRGAESKFAKKAEQVCNTWPVQTRDACIFDVLATGDLTMAIRHTF